VTLKELRNLLPSFMFIRRIHAVNYAAKLVHTRLALSNTIINSHQRRFQVKPAILLIPIDIFLFLMVEEIFGTWYRSGSFSLIKVGSGFYCLRNCSFFLQMHWLWDSGALCKPPS